MKYIIAIMLVLLVTGCSVKQPPVTKYAIELAIPQEVQRASDGCLDKSLKVAQVFSSSTFMSPEMEYREGKNKQYTYTQAQWYEAPNRALTTEFTQALREAQIFKNVQGFKSLGKTDWRLEISLEDFMQYFDKDIAKSYVKVKYNLTFIDLKTSKVLASKTFQSTHDAASLDANGGVIALNEALREAFLQSMEWINGVCGD